MDVEFGYYRLYLMGVFTLKVFVLSVLLTLVGSVSAYYEDFEDASLQGTLVGVGSVSGGSLYGSGESFLADGDFPNVSGYLKVNFGGSDYQWRQVAYYFGHDGVTKGFAGAPAGLMVWWLPYGAYTAPDGWMYILRNDDNAGSVWQTIYIDQSGAVNPANYSDSTDYELIIQEDGSTLTAWVQEAADPDNKGKVYTVGISGETRYGDRVSVGIGDTTGNTIAVKELTIGTYMPPAKLIINDGGGIVVEEGQDADFTVAIDISGGASAPTEDVGVLIDPDDSVGAIQLNGAPAGDAVTVTFTPGNWDTPKTVTVHALDNVEEDGNKFVQIDSSASSSDPCFVNLTANPIFVTVTDNDRAGDVNQDDVIDLGDLFALLVRWLDDCYAIDWCDGADLTAVIGETGEPGTVDMADYAVLFDRWEEKALFISEFMASNSNSFSTQVEGQEVWPDWIEIHNAGSVPIDLDGYYLTDKSGNLTKWEFPAGVIINAGEYLIVFASKKEQEDNPGNYPYLDSSGYYHTNFKLSASGDGEHLALVKPDGLL